MAIRSRVCAERAGLFRQSIFGRLAGYEDVNDAQRLRHDPAMRWIVGGKAAHGSAASPSQMGRFETKWLAAEKNLSAFTDLSGQWNVGTSAWGIFSLTVAHCIDNLAFQVTVWKPV